jgi:hypothetical protein
MQSVDFLTTIRIGTDTSSVSGPVTVNFADPFKYNPVPGTTSDPVGATAEPVFPNLHGNPPLTPTGPQISNQGNMEIHGPAGMFTVNVTANTAITQIADHAGSDPVNITGNSSQLSFVDNASQPETINLGDNSHGIDAVQGTIYLGSQSSFGDNTNELSVNVAAAASASAGTWSLGQAQAGSFGPGSLLYGLSFVPAGSITNTASLTVAVNAELFTPNPFDPSMPVGPTTYIDSGPNAIVLNLKTGSTLQITSPGNPRLSLGTAIAAHGNGSTLISDGGQIWTLRGENSGMWPVAQVHGADKPTFLWDGMTTLQGQGNDTLNYSALLGVDDPALPTTLFGIDTASLDKLLGITPDANLDYHVNFITGQATDVNNGASGAISGFDRVIPDEFSVTAPGTQSAIVNQPLETNLTIPIVATVNTGNLFASAAGLPSGLAMSVDNTNQKIIISGTPTVAGVYHVTLIVFDSDSPVADGRVIQFEWDVNHVYHIAADPEDYNQTAVINQPYGHFKIHVLDERGKYEDIHNVPLTARAFAVTFQAKPIGPNPDPNQASGYFVQTTGGPSGPFGSAGGPDSGQVTTQVPYFSTFTDGNGDAEIGDGASTLTANGFAGPFTLEVQASGGLSSLPIAPVDLELENVAPSVATTTDLAASFNPAISGQLVTYTAHVTRNDGAVAAGSIQFTVNGQDEGPAVPLSAGTGLASTQISLVLPGGVSTNFDVGATYVPHDPTNVDPSSDHISEEVDPLSVHSISSAIGQAQENGSPINVLLPGSLLPVAAGMLSNVTGLTQPVSFTLTLTGGASGPVSLSVPPDMFATVRGGAGASSSIVGGAAGPALELRAGKLKVENVTIIGINKDPTVEVRGGSIVLRRDVVLARHARAAAIEVAPGAIADFGTAQDPGRNTFVIRRSGKFVISRSSEILPAVGNASVVGRRLVHSYYVIAKYIKAPNAPVMLAPNQYFLPRQHASRRALQQLVDAVPAGSTVNVQRGVPLKFTPVPGVIVAFGSPGTIGGQVGTLQPNVEILIGPLAENPPIAGRPVDVFVDFLAPADGDPVPTGIALIYIDGEFLEEAPLVGGSIILDGLIFASGRHTITVDYLGDAAFAASNFEVTFNALLARQP